MTNQSSDFAGIFVLTIALSVLWIGLAPTAAATESPPKIAPVSASSFGGDGFRAADDNTGNPINSAEVLATLEKSLFAPRLIPPVIEGVVLGMDAIAAPIVNLQTGIVYTDLQMAIDSALPGDQLRIQQDLSVGSITIDKDLIIGGLTGEETLRATASTGSSGDTRGWFLVETGVVLHFHDLIVDGNGFSIDQGFRHTGTGSFEKVEFTDIQFEASGPSYRGTAIAIGGSRVDVRDCTFENIGRVGVLYFGSSITGAIFERNTFVGKGDGDFLDYGLEVNAGASVAAWSNSFVACRGVASTDGSTSAGILATTFSGPGTVVLARENTIMANAIGVAIGFDSSDTTTADLSFNRIVGNQDGVQNLASAGVAAQRNWWGCNDGPGFAGCDTIAPGSGAGTVGADPWLVLSFAAQPNPAAIGCPTALVADLVMDSDSTDTSTLGNVPDGTPATFDGDDLGTPQPEVGETFGGFAQSYFVADGVPGLSEASATVDNQTESVWISLEFGVFCDGFESGDTSAWSSTVG